MFFQNKKLGVMAVKECWVVEGEVEGEAVVRSLTPFSAHDRQV